MRETLDRFQLLWPKRQRQALARLAKERGLTLTEMARQAIDIGIHQLEQEDEFTRRGRALKKIEALHAKILERNGGKPLDGGEPARGCAAPGARAADRRGC